MSSAVKNCKDKFFLYKEEVELIKKLCDSNNKKALTCKAAAAAREEAAVTDVKNLENELGLCAHILGR